MSIKQLIQRSIQLYPNSKRMRHDWVRQTFQLYTTGKHALLNGGWRNGER